MNFWRSVCLKSGSHDGFSGICIWVHWAENFDAFKKNGTKHGKDEAPILEISVLFSLDPGLNPAVLSLGSDRSSLPLPRSACCATGHGPRGAGGPEASSSSLVLRDRHPGGTLSRERDRGLGLISHAVRRMNHLKPDLVVLTDEKKFF